MSKSKVLLSGVMVLLSSLNITCIRCPDQKMALKSYQHGTVGVAEDRPETVRERKKLNSGWRFVAEDVKNAQAFNLDDSNWRELNLPHDWAIEGPFTKDVSFQGGYLPYPGVGWYRKAFTIPSAAQCIRVEFEGVMRDARVRTKLKGSDTFSV